MAVGNSSELFHASLRNSSDIHTRVYIHGVRPEPRHNPLKGRSVMETHVRDPVGITGKWLSQGKACQGECK